MTDFPIPLGRDDDCRPPLIGDEVSLQHATILAENADDIVIRDGRGSGKSTNGVFVNGSRAERSALRVGDVVRLGNFVGIVGERSARAESRPFRAWSIGGTEVWGGAALERLFAIVEQVALSNLQSVVVLGETGSGKEAVARALHEWSTRKDGPFVTVNCAILGSLAESLLFGYAKGAFTGADRDYRGYFLEAHGGTLFLDEVPTLSLEVQAKLLRVVEQREVRPLGKQPAPVDVQIVVATQTPLAELAAKGNFRTDLCMRLEKAVVRIPPLRERKEDIPLLFMKLLNAAHGSELPVSPKLIEQLCLYAWPGNVRQLQNAVSQILIDRGHGNELRRSHAARFFESQLALERAPATPRQREPSVAAPGSSGETASDERPRDALADVRRICRYLRETDGNVQRAADLVQMKKQSVYRLLQELLGTEGRDAYLALLRSKRAVGAAAD